MTKQQTQLDSLISPSRDYSLMPFWFWNDELTEEEILRQIADFADHGVYGFVIHPRVGLPRSLGWMSDRLLRFMAIAIDESARRGMTIILYDEGMYPSGSSSGQVVAANPEFACRCLAKVDLPCGKPPALAAGENLVAELNRGDGRWLAVIDRPADAYIRGLHYVGEGPAEDEPPMADILNPQAVRAFIRLVYDRYADAFGRHFGRTVRGIFTDEPNPLGKCREQDVWPGTTQILPHVNALLGYDFTPHLPSLWYDDDPAAQRFRRDYRWAIQRRLEETWYRPLFDWCRGHGVALCGHPAAGDEIGAQRFFDVPGQDLVWRLVEPGKPSALDGPESTQAKCTSSAMIHLGRERNSNEFCGAYGSQTTFAEMKWLADWCLVRGVNLLIPHAFYYSVRGPRRDERPPQLGPHSPWWEQFKPFADHCRRLCWLNSASVHVCDIAILTGPDQCPWSAAKVCFQNQRDFNYLEVRLLDEIAKVDAEGIGLAGMQYRMLIVDGIESLSAGTTTRLAPMIRAGRVVVWGADAYAIKLAEAVGAQHISMPATFIAAITGRCFIDVQLSTAVPDLRYRHVRKREHDYYLFFNEGGEPLEVDVRVAAEGTRAWIDTVSGTAHRTTGPLRLELAPFGVALLQVGR